MTARTPFKPHYGSNLVVAPAAGAATATISRIDKSVRICNSGAAIGYFRISNSVNGVIPATVADCPVLSNQTLIIEKEQDADSISYISATGTTFQIMTGEGGTN